MAKKIAQFNKEMHSTEICWNREKAISHEVKKAYKNIEILKDYVEEEIIDQLFQYAKLFEDYLKSKKQFCITHGDLWADNLIVNDNNELSGIIDFGNMSYFLPEVDYASMWNMTEGFLDLLIKFNKEDMTKENIYLFVMHRELCSFEYIITADPEDVSSQLEKIKTALNLIYKQTTKQYV